MNPYVALAAAIGLAASHWWAFQAGQDAELGAQARADNAAARAGDAAASAAAAAINRLEVRHVTIRQQMEREVRVERVFADCRSGPRVVELFNAGLEPAAPASGAGGVRLSATDGSGR